MDRGRPSKKIFFLILACLIGVSSIGWAVYSTKASGRDVNKITDSNQVKAVEQAQKILKEKSEEDQDYDGLANWEEALWGTDVNNPDSDHDGTKDGDEAKNGRNPAVAGPNDKVNVGQSATTESALQAKPEVQLDNTETGKIGRDLFASYMKAKQSGKPLDSSMEEQIIQQALLDKSLTNTAKKYLANQVGISLTDDIRSYGNDLGLAFYAGASSETISEAEIVQKALTEKSPEELNKLDPIIKKYEATLNALTSVQTPKNYVAPQVDLLNAMSSVTADIKGFKKIFEDPAIGVVSLANYQKDIGTLSATMQTLKSVFESNNITFEQREYGSMFMRAI